MSDERGRVRSPRPVPPVEVAMEVERSAAAKAVADRDAAASLTPADLGKIATRRYPRVALSRVLSARSAYIRARPSTDEYIKRIVDASPPLTAEQRDRLAAILRPYL